MRTEKSFDQFWAAYPRRVAKHQAWLAWVKLDPDPALVDAILAAIAWQRCEWTDLRYCPHPTTYLRHRRWEDEPARPALTRFASLGVRR